MIGRIVLQQCLESTEIGKVTSLVRRPSGIIHNKLVEHVCNDFTNYDKLEAHFQNQDIAYYCIGVYTGTVSREEFRKITVDYTLAFADMLKKNRPEAAFCFLSGAGADTKEKSRMMFAQDKGIAENYLRKSFGKIYIFRPAYIFPVYKREEPNFSYRITRSLYPLIKLLGANMSIKSTELAEAIFRVGIEGAGKTILENRDIRNFLKS